MHDVLGWLAAGLVLAAFCSRRMVPLRIIATASNLAFMAYGSEAGLWPILALHSLMLPINVIRLQQETAIERPGEAAPLTS